MRYRHFLVAALVLISCDTAMSEGLSENDRAAITSILDTLAEKKMTAEDAPRRALYSDDIVQMIPELAEPVRGIKELIIDANIPITFALTIEDMDGGGDFAYVRASIRMTYAGESDTVDTVDTYGAMMLWILKKQPDGKWLFTNEIFTFEQLDR